MRNLNALNAHRLKGAAISHYGWAGDETCGAFAEEDHQFRKAFRSARGFLVIGDRPLRLGYGEGLVPVDVRP